MSVAENTAILTAPHKGQAGCRKNNAHGSPSDPVDRQLFLDVFAKKDWNCGSSLVPLQRGH